MKKLISLFIFSLAVLSTSSLAQNTDYKKDPGYIEFGDLSSFQSGDNASEILLDERLLKLAAENSKKEDSELKDVLKGLKLVKVNSFFFKEQNESRILNKLKSLDAELTSKSWERIIKMQSNGNYNSVYVKTKGGNNVAGLVVTTLNSKGMAVFINIVGDINLESLSRLSKNLGIPSLNSFGLQNK